MALSSRAESRDPDDATQSFRGRIPRLTLGMTLRRIQPFHIIGYPRFKWKFRRVTERAARVGQIRLGEILVMGVRIIEVIRLKISLERAIQNKDELVKRSSLAAAEIVNSARAGIERANCSIHHILHINEIAALFAVFENARALA